MEFQITDGRIFSADDNNELQAEATYVYTADGEVDIDHTYVNPALRGKGVAGEMMHAVVKHLRERGLKATATCSYANAWLRKNREACGDILSDVFR